MTRDGQLEDTVERIEKRIAIANYREALKEHVAAQERVNRAWAQLVAVGADSEVEA